MSDALVLDEQDAKLVVLAKGSRGRASATHGAAVRDGDGRTYAAAPVSLPSLQLGALQVAVAMAVSSGARVLEAAVVFGDALTLDATHIAAVHDLSPDAPIYLVSLDGVVTGSL
jgi:hypothetical protein